MNVAGLYYTLLRYKYDFINTLKSHVTGMKNLKTAIYNGN